MKTSIHLPMDGTFKFSGTQLHDFNSPPGRTTAPTRPRTADGNSWHTKAARMSFFEAFAIDAGKDIFSFPKPLSVKAASQESNRLSSVASSRQTSPLIGVAYGSPSHIPQHWSDLSSTPRTPKFFETFINDVAPEPLQPVSKSRPAWKRVGSLFRWQSSSSKSRPAYSANVTAQSDDSQRPKSRGLTLLNIGRKSCDVQTHELTSPAMLLDSQPQSPSFWRDWRASPKIGSPLRRVQRSRPSKISWTTSGADETIHIRIAPTHETTLELQRPSPLTPKLELQIPSAQLERYSVMFEKVLDQKASLYERRKSRMLVLGSQEDSTHVISGLHVSSLASTGAKDYDRPPLERSATSPSLSTSHLCPSLLRDGPGSRAVAFHKPLALRRSNTTPVLQLSPLRRSFIATAMTPVMQLESPQSLDDSASFPRTPSFELTDGHNALHIVTHALPSFQITSHEDSNLNIWHTVLPAPLNSSTSSRFSIDIHKALDSPTPLSRSQSHGGMFYTPKQTGRQVQVAVARKVDIAARDSQVVSSQLRPKVVEVGAQALPRRPSNVKLRAND